jgi:hypothetical protein
VRVHEAQHQNLAGAAILNNRGHQASTFFKCDFHELSPNIEPKTKIPLGLLRQRADEYVLQWVATYDSTGAANGRDVDGADAPEEYSKRSFAGG